MARTGNDPGPGAVAIAEEAFFLLRGCARRSMPYYLIGTMPFLAALIAFWGDMARHPLAMERAPAGALLLTALFVWMRAWQAVFAQRLLAEARGAAHAPRRPLHVARMMVRQAFAHAVALVLLPFAMLLVFPFGHAYAFIHTYTILEDGSAPRMRDTLRETWPLARAWPQQNYLLIWLCSPFMLVALAALFTTVMPIATALTPGWTSGLLALYALVLVIIFLPLSPIGLLIAANIAMGIYLVPFLIRTLFGVRTLLNDGLISPFNTTFLLVVCGLAYACLDPLMKSAYVLRVFHGQARTTGEDLRRQLRALLAAATPLLAMAALLFCATAEAQAPGQAIDPGALDQAIDAELAGPEYQWRDVIEHPLDAGDSAIAQAARAFGEFVKESLDTMGDWLNWAWDKVRAFFEWIYGRGGRGRDGAGLGGGGYAAPLRVTLLLLSAALTLLLVYLGLRAWRARQEGDHAYPVEPMPLAPDLRDEAILASDLPEDEWLRMARDCLQRGEPRLAARALFLATLALLADRKLIRIARHKSNRDYGRELSRYRHERPALVDRYAESMDGFEAVWYGDHPCTPETVNRLARNREDLVKHE
jgi:hypothetical protein